MPKVLISDALSPRAVEIFKERGIEVDFKKGLSPGDLIECIGAYHGLAVRSATKVTAKVIEAATALKVIGRAGIGVDNIDVNAASAGGVVVMNAPFGNAITTAEHTIAMMFALARQIPAADRSTQGGKWEKSRFMGIELTGKTLGIIGCGNIGSIVAERAIGLKMKVSAYDPYLSPDRAEALGVEKIDLETLFQRADVITLHTPLTDATRDILNAEAFARMKQGVLIVNCARGELIVEKDIKDALGQGRVGGLALDVYPEEPPGKYSLFGIDGVVATPHLGAATTEAQEKVAVQIAEQMSDFLIGGSVVNAINVASISADEAARLGPYMVLAEQLGSFAGQLTQTGLRSVTVEYQGHVAELNIHPLTACALTGLLSPMLEAVNVVNAPHVARERNIDVTEISHERAEEYQTMIRFTVTTERRSRTVAGTLFGDKPRIVDVNGVAMEAELAPHMLYTVNADRPGFIGRLGTVLGEAGVNIATFNLGRTAMGGEAIALVGVDQPVDEDVLRGVLALADVLEVKALSF